MVTVPSMLLRRLYVKGSMKNTPDGFRFELRNSLGSGYTHKVHSLSVDGAATPSANAVFDMDGEILRFDDVSRQNTLTLPLNRSIEVRVSGVHLAPGARKIGMAFDVPGLGTLRFDFTDTVAADGDA